MTYKFLLMALLSGILVACGGEKVQNAPESGTDLEIPSFTWKVREQEALKMVYVHNGMTLDEGEGLHGFVGLSPDGTYVVYTQPPKYVDDQVACTLGHEVMHIVLGNYHEAR